VIAYETCCARLDEFFGELPDTDDSTLSRAVSALPDVAYAALAILAQVFTPRDPLREHQRAAPYTALASIVLKHAAPQRARFVDEVALSIENPGLYRLLAPRIVVAVPPAQLEEALIAAIKGRDEVRCANALAIQEYLYGPTKGLRLSDGGRAAIARAVEALREREELSRRVAVTLASYTAPE
jgi:hypothetical protein